MKKTLVSYITIAAYLITMLLNLLNLYTDEERFRVVVLDTIGVVLVVIIFKYFLKFDIMLLLSIMEAYKTPNPQGIFNLIAYMAMVTLIVGYFVQLYILISTKTANTDIIIFPTFFFVVYNYLYQKTLKKLVNRRMKNEYFNANW